MIVAVGTDHATIARFAGLWQRSQGRILARVCTDREGAYCEQQARPFAALAARWCAKEAVAKCLGTGFSLGITPLSIEVVREASGALRVVLHGAARARAKALGITRVHLSISHKEDTAFAVAIAEGRG